MAASLEETLISVWQQVMIEKCQEREAGEPQLSGPTNQSIKIARTGFQFEGHELRGLEQNPKTASRWAQLARQGKKVMQFLTAAALRCSRGRSQSAVL